MKNCHRNWGQTLICNYIVRYRYALNHTQCLTEFQCINHTLNKRIFVEFLNVLWQTKLFCVGHFSFSIDQYMIIYAQMQNDSVSVTAIR